MTVNKSRNRKKKQLNSIKILIYLNYLFEKFYFTKLKYLIKVKNLEFLMHTYILE